MGQLLGGIDVSGSQRDGNHKFIAVVMCTGEFLNRTRRSLGVPDIRAMPKNTRTRQLIASVLRFDSDCLVFCCRIERDAITKKYYNAKNREKKSYPGMFVKFNRVLFNAIKEEMSLFLACHKCERSDVYFECDGDSEPFTKDVGLSRTGPGEVHRIADVVAWLNNKGREPPGIIAWDLRRHIQASLG